MAYSTRGSPSSDESMQKYMRLCSQQDALRRRISLQIPSSSPMNIPAPDSSSSSPTTSRASLASEPYSSFPLSAYPHPNSMTTDGQEESQKLYEINQKIKATLTELLNTGSVKQDDKFRVWVQGRLMDAELEMRRQRRRRSSVDREIAESIAEHFEHSDST